MKSKNQNLLRRRALRESLLALSDDPRRLLGRLLAFLILAQVLLVAMHFVVTTFFADWASQAYDGHIGVFDLDDEATLAVWFSSSQLLVLSLVSLLLSWSDEVRTMWLDSAPMWRYSGAILFIMSVDEVAGFHEMFGNAMTLLLPQVPIHPSLWWSIPYAIALAPVFGFALFRSVGKPKLVTATVCSGLLWVAANALEFFFLLPDAINVALEEGFEMLGATVLLGVFATHLLNLRGSVT